MNVRLFLGIASGCIGTVFAGAQETLDVLLRAPLRPTAAEYFIDRDPGEGLARSIELPPAAELVRLDVSIGELKLAPGGHELYLRFRDQHGQWGHPTRHSFFVMPYGFQISTEIQGAEYFFDDDPGFGEGTSMEVSDEGQIIGAETLNIADVKPGGHELYYRLQDSRGQWLPAVRHSFFLIPTFEATSVSYRIGNKEMTLDRGLVSLDAGSPEFGYATETSNPLVAASPEGSWTLEAQIILNGGIPWLITAVPFELSEEPVEPWALPPLPGSHSDMEVPVEPVEVVLSLAVPPVLGLGSTLTLGLEQAIDQAVQVEQSGNLRDWFLLGVLEPGQTELSISVGVGSRFFRIVPLDSTDATGMPIPPPIPQSDF